MKGPDPASVITSQKGWLNTSRPLERKDLLNRVILLDFWTFCCINCIHVIPDLKYLEEKFGDRLTVIGVHSAKFANERDSENIRSAILRYGIEHPVVNDFDFSIWQRFGVRAWPTFILIDPKGHVVDTYSGEGNRAAIERDIEATLKRYADVADEVVKLYPLPLALEKNKEASSTLSFPGKIAASTIGKKDVSAEMATLYVSDSGYHRVLALTEEGEVLEQIGSGTEGYRDGNFAEAQFRRPQGVLFAYPYVYVADTENHALRRIDLKNKRVETIAGTGKQGYERRASNADALSTPLASPWDLAFYPDDKHIAIAMAGTHQLWSYDIEAKTVSVIAGNGSESIDDGIYPYNSLSQPSGFSVYDGKLYFVDSETSSLRVLEGKELRTLIGTGLFDFGYKEGVQGQALMQHALGVHADETGVYIADSYNHSIRRYDPQTGYLHNYSGTGKRGSADGALAEAQFNEPNDIKRIDGKYFVTDTNNNAIRVIDPAAKTVTTLKIDRPAAAPAAAPDSAAPNLEKLEKITLASDAPLAVELKLSKGWKINHEAPSTLELYDMSGDMPVLVKSYATAELEGLSVTLPALRPAASYLVQGTFYYCEQKEGAQCLIKSVHQPVRAEKQGLASLVFGIY